MKFLSYLILSCCVMMFSKHISAQQYFLTNYTVADGLSNNAVGCILKDNDGYIWAGTEGGLNRFNGYDFTVYKSLASDTTTLSSNVIHCLLTDHSGNVWIGTTGGICLFNKKNNSFTRLPVHSLKGVSVSQYETFRIVEDSKKNIWAGVSDFGLVRYDDKQQRFIQVAEKWPPLSNNMVNGIVEDNDGSLWLVSYGSLFNYNPETRTIKDFENRLSDDHSKFQGLDIFKDVTDNNFLWIGTWGSGLVHFNKQTGEFISYRFHPNGTINLHNIVFDVHYHEKHKIWLATSEGIAVFNEEKKVFEGFVRDSINENGVINTEAHCIYSDDENIIWIATVNGLSNINPVKQNFLQQILWSNPFVTQYYFDEAQDKIYGTRIYINRALYIYDRKLNKQTEYRIPHADELQAEAFSVLKDDHGLIWLGTTKGIYTFNERDKKFSLFEIENQLHIPNHAPHIRNGIKTSDGKIWFGYYSRGLIMVDVNTRKAASYFCNLQDTNTFPLYAVTGLTEGKKNVIYACDEKRGVAIFDYARNITTHYNPEKKIYASLKNATDIAVDKSERIWVTTKNNGLVSIDKHGAISSFTRDEFGNIIDEQSNIVIDGSGKIWLTANNGIYRFNPETKVFTRFTLHDGLPARTVPLNKLSNGMIGFITRDIFYFDPLKISNTSQPLQVHLTSFLVNGKVSMQSNSVDQLDTIRLQYDENNITFEFAAINFTNPSSTFYSYFLEGRDNNWSAPTRTRTINFAQLTPGNYLLRLRAGTTELNDTLPEKRILIEIIPAWWQTAWFKWLTVAASIIVLFFITRFFLSIRYKQRIAQLERQREIEAVRMRISRDIHDEIGSGLTKIKLMSRNLYKAKEEVALLETTNKISTASDELIQNLGEIVWTINPANDTLENVFGYVRNYVSKLFDENPEIKLMLDFTEPEKIPHIIINPEVKRNLLLIIKESLTNTFKHAHATEVYVIMVADKSKLELRISDNGKGMKENQNNFGNGLKNMRRRAESIHAELNIESETDKGTTVEVRVRL